MFAIVNIAGFQYKVEANRYLYVNRLAYEAGQQITFDEVLLVNDSGGTRVGKPFLSGAGVTATVLEHLKDEKVIVFKKKRRKGYQKLNGHRQHLTKIKIDAIKA